MAVPTAGVVYSEYHKVFGYCHDATINFDSANSTLLQVAVESCTSSEITLNYYASGSSCSGPPAQTVTMGLTDGCSTTSNLHGWAIGNVAFACNVAQQPAHNKCYNGIGMSTPPCQLKLTSQALKWTCNQPGYTSCAITGLGTDKNTAEAFACCI